MFDYQTVERPYPGLRPFEPWEAEIFFGREAHIDRLLEILKAQHFLTVTGPSGCGKSSLVRAGLLPSLPLGAIGTGSEWKVAIMRPGDQPLQSLSRSLCSEAAFGTEVRTVAKNSDQAETSYAVATVETELRRGPLGLVHLVENLRQHAEDPEFNLLVLVDQFEEIFTYTDAGTRQAEESEAFIDLLLRARDNRESRIFIVITMRTDFLGNCTRFLELPEAINRSQYLTPRLKRAQLTDAIAGPARVIGGDLQSNLVLEFVNAAGNEPDQLPVLQHALARMWDQACEGGVDKPKLSLDDFVLVGVLGTALSEHANDVLKKLPKTQQLDAQWLFRAITDLRSAESGGQMIRRPQSLARIAAWSDRPWQQFLPVLAAFADSKVNFITYAGQPEVPGNNENTVVDISHEALIRHWDTLKNWVKREAQAGQEFRQLSDRALLESEGKGSLLTGPDLARALEWQQHGLSFSDTNTPDEMETGSPNADWALRYQQTQRQEPTTAFQRVETFIKRSQDIVSNSEARERTIKLTVIALTCLFFLAGLGAGIFGYYNYRNAAVAEARFFWYSLPSNSPLSEGIGADGLLAVARSNKHVREQFFQQILNHKNIAEAFSAHSGLIMKAAVGINADQRDKIALALQAANKPDLPNEIYVANVIALLKLNINFSPDMLIEAIRKTTDPNQLEALGQGSAVVEGNLGDTQATGKSPKLVDANQMTNDSYQFEAPDQSLAAFVDKIGDIQSTAVVSKYVEAIQNATDYDQLDALGKGLAVAVRKLGDTQVAIVVSKFVESIQKSTTSSQVKALGQGLTAAAGQVGGSQVESIALKLLEAIQKTTDPNQLDALGQGLSVVGSKLSGAQVERIALKLLEAIRKIDTKVSFQLNALVNALGSGLVAVVGKLDDTQTASLAPKLLEAIQTTDSYQLKALGRGLVAIAGNLDDTQERAVVSRYVEAILKTTTSNQLSLLGQDLAAVAGKLGDTQAAAVVLKFVEAIQKSVDNDQLDALGQGLAVTAGRLGDTQVASTALNLLEAIQKTRDPNQLDALGQGLAVAAGKLSNTQAAAVVTQFVGAIQKSNDYDQLDVLGQGLAAAADKLDNTQVTVVVSKYVEAIQKIPNSYHPVGLGQGLAVIVGKLGNKQAGAVVSTFVEAIRKSADSDYDQLEALDAGLAAVADRLSNTQAEAVVSTYIEAIQKTTATSQLNAFGHGLSAVAGKLGKTQAEIMSTELTTALYKSTTGSQASTLANIASVLVPRLTMNDSQSKQWLELCKNPFIDRAVVAEAIRKNNPDAPKAEQGIWAFLDWAVKRYDVDDD